MTTPIDISSLKKPFLSPVVKKTLIIAAAVLGTIGAGALAFAAVSNNSDDSASEDSE